jgi:hypothetical protein
MIKPVLILSLVVLATASFSCGTSDASENHLSIPQKQTDIVVFIDKSRSVSFENVAIFNKAIDKVKNTMSILKNSGDKISFYYLHGNTVGATKVYSYTIPVFDYPPNSSTMEINSRRINYNLAVSNDLQECIKKMSGYLKLENNAPTNNGTDIIGVLDVICRNLNADSQKNILIFSDGKQTSSGFKCDPKTTAQAISLANTHLSKIPDIYTIDKNKVKGSKAEMILPYDPLNTNHNKFLNDYWNHIFSAYSIDLIVE